MPVYVSVPCRLSVLVSVADCSVLKQVLSYQSLKDYQSSFWLSWITLLVRKVGYETFCFVPLQSYAFGTKMYS